MADGSTLTQNATPTNTSAATIATEARRYWVGILSRLVRYLLEPIDAGGPSEELRMFLVIPSTPTSRARAERVKAAVLEAAAKHQTSATPVAQNGELVRAVIEAARGAIGRVSTARALAAAFGLDVRLYSWRGTDRFRHVYEEPTLHPSGTSFGAHNGDAPTLSMSTSVEADAFVENIAWGVGSLISHWLGVKAWARDADRLARTIGYALAIRDEDITRPVLLDAWFPHELDAAGDITDASASAREAAVDAECLVIAGRLECIASAAMVRHRVVERLDYRLARRCAGIVCSQAATATWGAA